MADFDLAIIGGGINGAGIARDAAGRRLRVLLVEQNDLASGTSSASTKLIHGGLRYLEHGEFRLVREALTEREVLWNLAPHNVRPLRFVLPHQPGMRSPLILRIGLFIYDHIGGRKRLPASRTLDLSHHVVGVPLKRRYQTGFEYSDCWADDARLVVLNAIDAAERGAVIRTRTRCIRADRSDVWRLVLNSRGRRDVTTARVLVNAAGPWVGDVVTGVIRHPGGSHVRLVKGTHIVVPRMFDHNRAYIFQLPDQRIVFAIPYEHDFTMIGTTDLDFKGDPGAVAPSADEVIYLCKAVNIYFREQIGPEQVVWAFAGVRSLYDDGSRDPEDLTRDYVLDLEEPFHEASLLTIYGGKITTYRRLAEHAMDKIAHFFAPRRAWTAKLPLPGGDFAPRDIDSRIAQAQARWPFLTPYNAARLVHAYGTRIDRVLGSARSVDDLGPRFGADLTAAEVRYQMQHEWAMTADDVLWRRTKLGLRVTADEREALARFMAETVGRDTAA